jgi:large subunit ribosomal protein L1
MGKTKIAVVDDSQPKEKEKKEQKKLNPNPAKLNPNPADEQTATEARPKLNPNLAKEKKETAKEPKETKAKEKASEKKGKTHGAKYLEAKEKVEHNKPYAIDEAIELAKKVSYSKFEGTLELHINTNSKNLRGLVSLPHAAGKKLKIIAFGKGAEESGADIVGDEKALADIEKGRTGFDVIVTSPEWMPRLARAAKVLGPRGLMPNPKNGTISTDLKKAVTEIQSGKVEYKTQKDSQVIHLSIGKVSQPTDQINQNIKILLNSIGKTKVKKAILAPTMGPAVKVDLSSL